MRNLIIYFFLSILVISCSPQKRLQYLVKKHPELMTQDTLIVEVKDTIYIESLSIDTITKFFHSDTITVLNSEKLTLKYFYDTITKNIYHDVLIKNDTIFYETKIPVEVERVIIQELTWWEKNNQWIIFLIVLMTLGIIFQKIKKYLPL
tara:strand:+ start:3152 stop:3598 length:447 start_codon:yes stop_codon:yes gene_type:complete